MIVDFRGLIPNQHNDVNHNILKNNDKAIFVLGQEFVSRLFSYRINPWQEFSIFKDEVQRFILRVSLNQPIERIHLDAIDPQLPMQVWPCYAASASYFAY